jgi:AbrB family looped-hinge helix DNA binding protein
MESRNLALQEGFRRGGGDLGRQSQKVQKVFNRSSGLYIALVRCYLTFMKTVISSKGQIVLPADLRKQDKIRAGQQFEIERVEAGDYRLRRVVGPEKGSVLEWLLACPVKGWFRPVASESTDTIAPGIS